MSASHKISLLGVFAAGLLAFNVSFAAATDVTDPDPEPEPAPAAASSPAVAPKAESGEDATLTLPNEGISNTPISDVPVDIGDRDEDADEDKDEDQAEWNALEILDGLIEPGTRRDLRWTAGQSFAGSAIDTPIVVIHGKQAGPSLCLTAAIHGDELNGVEIVRRVLAGVDVDDLAGTIIGVPIVNLLGFSRGSRYLPDRRDLNRYFPGHPLGSAASRIAYTFFVDVIRHCDHLVDFHTGSFKRTNLPQLRADLKVPAVREFVQQFGATSVLHKVGARGTLREAATAAGIPAVAFELGEPGTLQLANVRFGVKAIDTLIDKLGMIERFSLWSEPQPVFYRSRWLRAYRGGILMSKARVGVRVNEGDILGVVTNPLTNEQTEILSPHGGRLLGRALNQFVLPGFATFHIGIETAADDAPIAEEAPPETDHEIPIPIPTDNLIDGGAEMSPVVDDLLQDTMDEEVH